MDAEFEEEEEEEEEDDEEEETEEDAIERMKTEIGDRYDEEVGRISVVQVSLFRSELTQLSNVWCVWVLIVLCDALAHLEYNFRAFKGTGNKIVFTF